MKKLLLISMIALFVSCQTQNKLNLSQQWKLVEMNGKAVTNADVTINFDTAKKEIHGNGGCNNYFGGYTLTGDELELSDNVGATKMYCHDTAAIEDEYFRTLNGKLKLKTTDNRLTMTKDGKTVLVFDVAAK